MGFSLKRAIPRGFAAYGTGGLSELGRLFGSGTDGNRGIGTRAPKFAMRKTSEFEKENPNAPISQEGFLNAQDVGKRFQGLRESAGRQAEAGTSTALQALRRRFAATGSGGSGAALGLEQKAIEAGERQKADVLANLDLAEGEAMDRQQQMLFQRRQLDFQNKVFGFDRASKMHALDLEERQQQIDSATTEFNKRLAETQANPQQGMVSRLLGGIL